MVLLNRMTLKVVQASCEIFFPENDEGVPDYLQTDLATNVMVYLDTLPPKQIYLLKIFYVLLSYLPLLLLSNIRKFENLQFDKRTNFLSKLEKSKVYRLRLLADGLKANLKMIYLNHPDVLQFLGEYRLRKYKNDKLEVELKPKAFANRDTKFKDTNKISNSKKKKTKVKTTKRVK